MTDKQSLIEFPCNFPIKILGVNDPAFIEEIIVIGRKYYPELSDESIQTQSSNQGNYTSITITVLAQDQKTLDALYNELTSHPGTKMVL